MSIQDSNIRTRTEIPDVLAASGYQEMLNQREEKTGAWLSGHGTYDIGKWSDFFPVCGKIVVKRKITANLAVIFRLTIILPQTNFCFDHLKDTPFEKN